MSPNSIHDNDSASLLIVESDAGRRAGMGEALALPGFEVLLAADTKAGLKMVCDRAPRIVVIAPQPGALDLEEQIGQISPATQVIRIAAEYDPGGARRGAVDLEELRERVRKSAEEALREGGEEQDEGAQAEPDFEGIVGRSPLMWDMYSRIRRIAPYYRAALITGETGTGKDLAARALHRLSPVSKGRYVVLNCSAVVETLFESELFGHVKGSFTGASCDKAGLFEHAHGGTLFLDEIGDMPLATQAKLLRVLQNQEVQRVGSLSTRKVDVRVIAATNHDLRALIAQKRFREDLYYRLSMVEIRVPRLADRKEDLPALQHHFLSRFATLYGKQIRGLSHGAYRRLAEHSWPGNVRELENVIGHAAMMVSGEIIQPQDLPEYLRTARAEARFAPPVDTLHEHERQLLIRALDAAGGNQSKAARLLRIGRDALRYKLRKHNLDEPEQAFAVAG